MLFIPDLIGISGGSGQCTSQHEGRQLLQVVLPVSVDQLFTLLFTNAKFFVDFHISRNSTSKFMFVELELKIFQVSSSASAVKL